MIDEIKGYLFITANSSLYRLPIFNDYLPSIQLEIVEQGKEINKIYNYYAELSAPGKPKSRAY